MLAVLITPFLLALLFSLILEPPIALLTRLYGSRKLAALLVFLSFLTFLTKSENKNFGGKYEKKNISGFAKRIACSIGGACFDCLQQRIHHYV